MLLCGGLLDFSGFMLVGFGFCCFWDWLVYCGKFVLGFCLFGFIVRLLICFFLGALGLLFICYLFLAFGWFGCWFGFGLWFWLLLFIAS